MTLYRLATEMKREIRSVSVFHGGNLMKVQIEAINSLVFPSEKLQNS